MSAHDEHIRSQVSALGRQCEIACALETLFFMKGMYCEAAEAAELAESLSARAFAVAGL